MDDDDSPTVRSALGYVICRGWLIFPVRFGTKRSHKAARYSGGRLWGMSNDPIEIERDFMRWPNAGIGIPTGEVNRIFVLEADTLEGHGVDGLAGLGALEARHGRLPATLTAQSPSGSVHQYFRWPGKEIKNSDGKLARGLDVRGDGGMIIAPPTRTPKGIYRWLNHAPIIDAPPWVIERARSNRLSDWFERGYRRRSSTPKTNRKPVSAGKLRDLMEAIPNDDATDWEEWNRIGLALFAATEGSDFGLELFHEWSEKHPDKYDFDKTLEKWEAFKTSPPEVITVGSLFYEADRAQFKAEMAAWERFCRSSGASP